MSIGLKKTNIDMTTHRFTVPVISLLALAVPQSVKADDYVPSDAFAPRGEGFPYGFSSWEDVR